MTTKRVTIAVVSMAAVLAGLGAWTTADAAPTSDRVSVAQVATERDRDTRAEVRFRPKKGVSFNVPGSQEINAKVLRAIRHSPKRSKIRAMTWNFNSWVFVNALRAAHNRGVSVRIIMARTLANEQGPNGPFAVMRRALAGGNNNSRRPAMKSWFRTCSHSCRGTGGAMHSKLYLFSKVGRAKQVVMSSSANLTGSAASAQYNDMYTIVGRKKPYAVSIKVFNEAAKDRPAPYRGYQDGKIRGWFTPNKGRPDLPYQMLNNVKCQGARGAGIRGRTSIRIAQDVFNGDRGAKIARRIKELHRFGCNVRIVYSQMAGQSREILAGVPKNHLVSDRDGDGAYDIYLHMKAMSISGFYGRNRGARIVYNGTANFSGIGLIADENGLVIERDGVERAYGRQINRLFNIHLKSVPLDPEVEESVERGLVIDPYRNMEQ
ncbi:MAG TPA: phospholipase D-like domain-containing protein [Nocardioides sp.]|nr:phospholipase D-like domain-containing protein [Nocardioides sp.]